MSSRVLLREHGSDAVKPMTWLNAGRTEEGGRPRRELATKFEPSVSLDHETAALRNKIVELERVARDQAEMARRQGLAEGEAQGRAQASRELEPVLMQLARSLEELAALRPKLRGEAESDVVQLSLAIARRILHRELSVEPEAIQALVQVALERLVRQEIYRVHVHPAQEAAIRKALAAHNGTVEVSADARLAVGALVFETNRGKMDASVAAQLEEIERGLTDRVKQR